jgi:hypothetical protein
LEEILALSRDKSVEVRIAVASNPATPADVVSQLAEDPDKSVRSAALRDPGKDVTRRDHGEVVPSETTTGNSFVVGDIGPGGGLVFFDAGSAQAWGQFLECAPAGWFGSGEDDPVLPWDSMQWRGDRGFTTFTKLDTRDELGTGMRNTRLMARPEGDPATDSQELLYLAADASEHVRARVAGNPSTPHDALAILATDPVAGVRAIAQANREADDEIRAGARRTSGELESMDSEAAPTVLAYRGGGCADWFLPALEELHLLFQFHASTGAGHFSDAEYWSSSEIDDFDGEGTFDAAYVDFGNDGMSEGLSKGDVARVRPVSAF